MVEVDVAPARVRGRAAADAEVAEARDAEELVPVLAVVQQPLDVAARDADDIEVLWSLAPRPLDPVLGFALFHPSSRQKARDRRITET